MTQLEQKDFVGQKALDYAYVGQHQRFQGQPGLDKIPEIL